MSEKSCFRGPFHKQHGKRAQTVLQCGRRNLYLIYGSLQTQFSWKKSMLVLCKIFRLFVNKWTPDDKSSLLNRDKVKEPIQILLSEKEKSFSQFFSSFLKSTLNFQHLRKKDHSHSRCISEITDSVKGEQINVSKIPFQRTFP